MTDDVPSTDPELRRALIVSASIGAGHDGVATELARRLRLVGIDVEVRDYLDALPWWARKLLSDWYYKSTEIAPSAFESVFAAIDRFPAAYYVAQRFCRLARRTIRRWIAESGADFVVSTYPLASQTLGGLRADGSIDCDVITYLTDPAVHRTWVHAGVDHHVTVTQTTAQQGSRDYDVSMCAAGPLVPDQFSVSPTPERLGALRTELGIERNSRVALVAAGSLGLGDIESSARDTLDAGWTPLVLCGRNTELRNRLAQVPGVIDLGWRGDVHELMYLADALIQNAGGLTVTEALVAGLPTVSYRAMPGHGQVNAQILDGAGIAPWARTASELHSMLAEIAVEPRRAMEFGDPVHVVLDALRGRTPTSLRLSPEK